MVIVVGGGYGVGWSECLNSKHVFIPLCPGAHGRNNNDSDNNESNSYHLPSTYCRQAPDSMLCMTPSRPSWQMVTLTHTSGYYAECVQQALCFAFSMITDIAEDSAFARPSEDQWALAWLQTQLRPGLGAGHTQHSQPESPAPTWGCRRRIPRSPQVHIHLF